MDSRRFSGEPKSNFSQSCSLLSQYLKEKRSFGDLSLCLSPNFQPHGPSTAAITKNLLSLIEESGQNMVARTGVHKNAEPEKAQMTIFYADQLIVFNHFPADKAKEIMAMASNAGSQNLANDVPLVRKASLARFFEKRKDRIAARAPYQLSKRVEANSRPTESKTWLALAAQSPQQIERQIY